MQVGRIPGRELSVIETGIRIPGMLPFVSDDAGTPFAGGIIAVDDKLAIKARS